MFASIRGRGFDEAIDTIADIADRARNLSPVFDDIADDVFSFQRKWWLTTYGNETDKDQRAGRNPAYMVETGGLLAASTARGAPRQTVKPTSDSLLIENTSGLAVIHEARGREVLGTPGAREVDQYAEKVAKFILLGDA